MNKNLLPFFVLIGICLPFASIRAQGKALIDTDFSQVNESNVPLASKEPSSEADFPIKLPTGNRETIPVQAPSSVVGGKEPVNGMPPPFALVTIKPNPEEKSKKGDGYFASAGLSWKFQKVPLGAGRYEASWTFLPLSPVRKLKMAFGLMGEKPDGELARIEPVVENHEIPLQIMVSGGKISAGTESVPVKEDGPNEIQMEFDLHKNTWSAKVNGKKLIRNLSFPQGYLAQFEKFWAVSFGIGSGGMEENGGAQYAVGPFKLTKLD